MIFPVTAFSSDLHSNTCVVLLSKRAREHDDSILEVRDPATAEGLQMPCCVCSRGQGRNRNCRGGFALPAGSWFPVAFALSVLLQ